MITTKCLACGAVTDHDGELYDMRDVVCPECRLKTRIVATPMNLEPPEEKR